MPALRPPTQSPTSIPSGAASATAGQAMRKFFSSARHHQPARNHPLDVEQFQPISAEHHHFMAKLFVHRAAAHDCSQQTDIALIHGRTQMRLDQRSVDSPVIDIA